MPRMQLLPSQERLDEMTEEFESIKELRELVTKIETLRNESLKRQGPKAELMWRLTQRANGDNPGQPANWNGLRGLLR